MARPSSCLPQVDESQLFLVPLVRQKSARRVRKPARLLSLLKGLSKPVGGGLGTRTPCLMNRTTHPGRWLRQPHLPHSEPRSRWISVYFLSTSFSEVHGTFRVMWPSPSVDLRFAVCMSELMSAISNTPSCWTIPTRSPRFGIVMLVPVFIWSSSHPHLRELPAIWEGL
jgi:hypothetical protein